MHGLFQGMPDIVRKKVMFQEKPQQVSILFFPLPSMALDTVSVHLKSQQMGKFMQEGDQESMWIQISVDRNPVISIGSGMTVISQHGCP
jgi:hypothetical protein